MDRKFERLNTKIDRVFYGVLGLAGGVIILLGGVVALLVMPIVGD